MNYKDALRMILDHGGEIKIPWKDKSVKEPYTRYVSLFKDRGKYGAVFPPFNYQEKDTLEEALEIFLEACNNIGAVQQYVFIKNQILDPDLLETSEIEDLVQKEMERRKNEKAS